MSVMLYVSFVLADMQSFRRVLILALKADLAKLFP
jgi:hypothetical protein